MNVVETRIVRHQKSVSEQNRATEAEIRKAAIRWRNGELPSVLTSVGNERNVNWDRSIVLRIEVDFPGMHDLIWGSLLTQDERFIDFELETRLGHTELIAVPAWEDVTSVQNVNRRNRGIGAGWGAIALKVLRELNAQQSRP